MNKNVFLLEDIANIVKPIAKKYGVKELYLFGFYARGEADGNSDLDFLMFGGENFILTMMVRTGILLQRLFLRNCLFS